MERVYAYMYQLTVNHLFYTNKVSSDFRFTPLSETNSLMKAYGLLFKASDSGFGLVYRVKEGASPSPQIALDTDIKLTFAISLLDYDLFHLTNFPAKSDYTDIYICSGDYSDAELSLTTIATRKNAFTESYTYTSEKVKFEIEDADGNVVHSQTLTGFQDPDDGTKYHFNFSVDMSSDPVQGRHKLKTYIAGIEEDSEEVYVFMEDVSGLFALMELNLNSAFDFTTIPYESVFKMNAASSFWTYRIILDQDLDGASFTLKDAAIGSTITFSETPDGAPYKTGRTVEFVSDDKITRSEAPVKTLGLEVTTLTSDIKIAGLPNPAKSTANSIVYLKI